MDTLSTVAPRRLPLESVWSALGAELIEGEGFRRPACFSSIDAERHALVAGAALVDRSHRARLELVGEDRVRFLNGYVTCDVKALAPGESAAAFVPDLHGRILADALVLALEDRIWLELPPGRAAAIEEHLTKYRLADRVEFRPLDDLVLLAVEGPAAAELLARRGVAPPAPFAHARVRLGTSEMQVARDGRIARPRYLLWVSASIAPAVVEELLAARAGERLVPAGLAATEVVRVEEGEPLYGIDFDGANFPQELGAEGAISFTKGCYLGQEVIARLHFRGQASRELRGVLFDPLAEPAAGVELACEGRPAGRATSVVRSAAFGRSLGLALLQRRALGPGARVDVAGDGRADVVMLPFRRAEAPTV